jgi:hypothetical protein
MANDITDTITSRRLKNAVNIFLGVAVMGGLFMLASSALAGVGFVVAVIGGGGPITDWQVISSYLALSGGLSVFAFGFLTVLNKLPGPDVELV